MSRGVAIGIGILVALCLCVCVAGAGISFLGGGAALIGAVQGPNGAFNAYYDAAKAEDWAKAYNQLSPDLRDQVTQQQLQQAFAQEKQRNGAIQSVSITNTQINNNTATITANIKRERQDGRVQANLVQINGEWKIDEFEN